MKFILIIVIVLVCIYLGRFLSILFIKAGDPMKPQCSPKLKKLIEDGRSLSHLSSNNFFVVKNRYEIMKEAYKCGIPLSDGYITKVEIMGCLKMLGSTNIIESLVEKVFCSPPCKPESKRVSQPSDYDYHTAKQTQKKLNQQHLNQQMLNQQMLNQQMLDQQMLNQQIIDQQLNEQFMQESLKSVTPFEMGGYDMTQGNSFNNNGFGF